jgi:hypothetical protein
MEMLWWRCAWDHVFPAPPVPEGAEMQCPGFDDTGPCATYFIYMPFASEAEARRGAVGSGEAKWAPWARGA